MIHHHYEQVGPMRRRSPKMPAGPRSPRGSVGPSGRMFIFIGLALLDLVLLAGVVQGYLDPTGVGIALGAIGVGIFAGVIARSE